ncbi:MAG TPA: 50S ribosomal protein L32, partial [Herpetosiphonaceae bacterium]|nr:50S ribosomal protein L32 [Herpetosiphonaceae bacterium]
MGAVPKRKVSRHRRGNRRRHQYLTAPQLTKCPNCGEYNL